MQAAARRHRHHSTGPQAAASSTRTLYVCVSILEQLLRYSSLCSVEDLHPLPAAPRSAPPAPPCPALPRLAPHHPVSPRPISPRPSPLCPTSPRFASPCIAPPRIALLCPTLPRRHCWRLGIELASSIRADQCVRAGQGPGHSQRATWDVASTRLLDPTVAAPLRK